MVLTLAEWLVLSAMSVLQGSQIWAEWLCVAHLALEVELMELMASFHRKRGKRPNLQCRSYRSGIAPGFPGCGQQVYIGRISCVHPKISLLQAMM